MQRSQPDSLGEGDSPSGQPPSSGERQQPAEDRPPLSLSGGIGQAARSANHAGLGCQFSLTLVLFTAAGWWIDQRLETLPLFLLVFAALGAVGGMISLVRRIPLSPRRPGGKGPSEP